MPQPVSMISTSADDPRRRSGSVSATIDDKPFGHEYKTDFRDLGMFWLDRLNRTGRSFEFRAGRVDS